MAYRDDFQFAWTQTRPSPAPLAPRRRLPGYGVDTDFQLDDVRDIVDLAAWTAHLGDLPRDPYVETRYKRMSWVHLNDEGEVEVLPPCPMAQGGQFNAADTMADKVRYYAPLTDSFTARDDFKRFVRDWAGRWGIEPREPILFQLNGVRGHAGVDPLQGQGLHADGCRFLSLMLINRENALGGRNAIYRNGELSEPVLQHTLRPGEVLHLRDDRVLHDVSPVRPQAPERPFERFVVIINARFVDDFQNAVLREHYPWANLPELRRRAH